MIFKINKKDGRKFNQEKIKKTKIKVPVNDKNTIDLTYIENYMKGLPYSEKI